MHLIYTQWHHLSSVPSVDWWTMLIQPMAVTKCCPPDGSHPRWSPHTRPRQPKAHWWGLSPLWWIGPRNPLGPRHSPCPCCHSPLPPPSYPRSSHQESLTLAAGTFRIPLTTLYTGCGPPLWSLQRCLRCQAAGTWCGCSWWGQHHVQGHIPEAQCLLDHHRYASPMSLFRAWYASLGNGSCCVVLGGEDIAAGPLHLTTQTDVGLTADSCLHGHVQGDSNMAPFSDLEVEDISCMCIRRGISFSVRPRALRPQAARLKSVAL